MWPVCYSNSTQKNYDVVISLAGAWEEGDWTKTPRILNTVDPVDQGI